MVEGADIDSALRYRRDGKLTIREWATSLMGVRETAYFARDDLAPFRVAMRGFMKPQGRGRPRLMEDLRASPALDVPRRDRPHQGLPERIGVPDLHLATCPFDPGTTRSRSTAISCRAAT